GMTAHTCCHPWRQGRTQTRRAVAAADSESLLCDAPIANPRESLAMGRRSIDRDAVGSARCTPRENSGWLRLGAERDARRARAGGYDGSKEAMFADVKADMPVRHRTVDLPFPFCVRLS